MNWTILPGLRRKQPGRPKLARTAVVLLRVMSLLLLLPPLIAQTSRADPPLRDLQAWIADPQIDVVISTGGTGVTGRDVTPEAFESVFEKKIDGFGELFRWLSYQKIGTSTIQSRATGGVANATYLFALPGSPSAARDGWEQILKFQLDNRLRPCNLVELMPRLNEHLKKQ